jgi:plastocyanin
MHLRLVTALLLTIIGVASAQGQAPTPSVVRIDIQGNKFNNGVPVTVRVGDTVIWVNRDRMTHTASRYSDTDGFNTGFIQAGTESEPITFLKASDPKGFTYACDVHDDPKHPMEGVLIVSGDTTPDHVHHESPSIHSMLVTGRDPNHLFLHHYDLFNNPNHSYHVTIEARIDDAGARSTFEAWRKANADARATIDPEVFLLPELKPGSGTRTSFKAKFSEFPNKPSAEETQWGTAIPGLDAAPIKVVRVIQFRAFDPNAKYPGRLTYQLYGNDEEVFLAHEVTEAPSFQQVVQLKDVPSFLTPDLIRSAPLVTFPSKRLSGLSPRVMKMSVLNNSTHLLLTPPINTLNPQPPLTNGEEVEVLIGSDPTLRKITIGKSIWEEFRIINR